MPCAPVNNLAQALADEHVMARHMVVNVPHPLGGEVRQPGNPIKMSDTADDSYSAPPLLGADTERVLRGLLGKTDAELAGLRARGIV